MTRPHLPLAEVGRAIFPRGTPSEQRVMAILTCYLDDSGTHAGSRHAVAGGLVAREDIWPDFESRWREALKEARIAHWHSSEAQHFIGQFEGKDEVFRRDALALLLPVIKDTPGLVSVGAIVPSRHWDLYIKEPTLSRLGTPWGLAVHMVMSRLGVKLVEQNFDPAAEIAYIIDNPTDGGFDPMHKFFMEVWANESRRQKYRILTAAPGKVSQYVELEAADLVAYELNKEWERYMTSSPRDIRYPMKELTTQHWHKFDVIDGFQMREVDADPMAFLYDA